MEFTLPMVQTSESLMPMGGPHLGGTGPHLTSLHLPSCQSPLYLSSRKGTTETAVQLVKDAAGRSCGPGGSLGPYIRDRDHMERLRAAAQQLRNSKLGEVIAAGQWVGGRGKGKQHCTLGRMASEVGEWIQGCAKWDEADASFSS